MKPGLKPLGRLLIPLFLVAAVAAAMAEPAKRPPRQYAIVVGIDQYEHPEVTPLRFAVADAHGMAQTLRALGYDEVFELTGNKPTADDYPNRTNIIFRLEWLQKRLRPEDSLIFFFSGHGIETDGKTFLLTRESDPRTLGTLKLSACPVADINEALEHVAARRILVIYDACRSDPRADKGGGNNLLSKKFSKDLALVSDVPAPKTVPHIVATLFACSPGQRSYEWKDKQHGYFTWQLMQGLRGRAHDSNGKVTLQSLIEYVAHTVAADADHDGYQQQPWVKAEGTSLAGWRFNSATAASAEVGEEPAAPATEPSSAPVEPSPSPTPVVSYLDRAQEAFKAGHFAEPPGDNAIELARQQLASDPTNTAAPALAVAAQTEYEKLAQQSLQANDILTSRDRFERLAALFPTRQDYQTQLKALQVLASGEGEWTTYANLLIFSASGRAMVRKDGTCTFYKNGADPEEGTWTCTSIPERAFTVHLLKSGDTAKVNMSADGQTMEGHMNNGAHLVMHKVR
jgi:hypothetical protein